MKWFVLLVCCLLPFSAWADPRLNAELVQALQAQVVLQQKAMRLLEEDTEAQKATLWQWLIEAKGGSPDAKPTEPSGPRRLDRPPPRRNQP